jgi:hypothetical protein
VLVEDPLVEGFDVELEELGLVVVPLVDGLEVVLCEPVL